MGWGKRERQILGDCTRRPQNRGVNDIFIACTDNLTGFSNAINAVFPQTDIQNCIVHQLRNSSKYVSYKDLKALMADLKAVYAAVDEPTAQSALDAFEEAWGKEISPDRCFLAGKLGEPEHIL